MSYTFKSKAEYLVARSIWKDDYLRQILNVREAKQGIKNANRQGLYIGELWDAMRALAKAREETTRLLTARAAMRDEAERQYLAAHSV